VPSAVATMAEAQLMDNVIELGHLFGFRIAHFRPARTAHGWRTAVAADGAGWPDLTMVRGDRLIFAELKSHRGSLSVDQTVWLNVLEPVAETYLWRPADWLDGSIEAVLRSRS
jgi:hypothetical protein